MLEPMIRPGSIVLIDTQKKVIGDDRRDSGRTSLDRPHYFPGTTRDQGYVSGFCELDKDEKWLTLVPHPLSYETSKRWRFQERN